MLTRRLSVQMLCLFSVVFVARLDAQIASYRAQFTLDFPADNFLGMPFAIGDEVTVDFKYDVFTPRQSPMGAVPADYPVSGNNALTFRVGDLLFVENDYRIEIENAVGFSQVDSMRIIVVLGDTGALVELLFADTTGELFADDSLPSQELSTSDFDELTGTAFDPSTINVLLYGSGTLNGSTYIPGDINSDGEVNLLDVGPFLDSIVVPEFNPAADLNCDGAITLMDVAPFVDLLANP